MNLNMQLVGRRDRENNSMGWKPQQIRQSAFRLVLLSVLSVVLFPALGRCSISIMPMESQIKVSRPGARLTNDIEVYNSGDAPIHVSTSVMDWTMTLSGQKQFQEAGTQPLSCAKWIQVNPVEFSLLPGKSMRVRYSATTPADITQEHWAMIFFTARAVPKAGDNRFALNVQTRMGCKVLLTPALKAPLQGKITGMALQTLPAPASQPPAVGATPVAVSPVSLEAPGAAANTSPLISKVKVTFVNPNPVSVRLNGTVEARSADGVLIAKGEIMPAKALMLVGATRELWAQFDKPLPPGDYQIKAAIDYGGKELVSGSLKATVRLPDAVTAIAAPVVAVALDAG
jgi:P pilus assembly chaperone PapD